MPAITLNSVYFLGIAREAAHRVPQTHPLEPSHDEAIVSVVFAAAAVEAYINELAEWETQTQEWITQEQPNAPNRQQNVLNALAQVLNDAENSRASVTAKYKLARWILCRSAYDEGANPYQDFALLMQLRNSLVHLKASAAVIKKLEYRGVLADDRVDWAGGWTERITTKEMAKWACDSASAIVCDMIDTICVAVPNSLHQVGRRFWE
jgi:hypothetical protein